MKKMVRKNQRRSSDMSWWIWALIGVGGAALVITARELPAIRRYLKMRKM